jgi:soluble lytic murein transglycosylase-like protein
MSIKPSDVLQGMGLLSQTNRRSRAEGQQRIGFADVLSSVAQRGATDFRALAEMCRLDMMRSSVSFADDNSFEQKFPSPLSSLDAYAAAASQNNDLLQAALPPTIEPVPQRASSPADSPVTAIAHRAAERYGLNPALVKAVIKAESNFNATVVSRAGAQGLMQLMPGTARDLGVSDPFDPEQNVMGGARYLKQLYSKYDGDIDKTLAAYNWGPGNVDRKGIDVLPEETRNYLDRVKRYQSEFLA